MPSGCREWVASKNDAGYGVSWDGKRARLAHRLAWEAEHGPLGDAVLRHRCDNPPCIRLDHLEPGTHADNVRDKMMRDRSGRKLNNQQKAEIRARHRPGKGGNLAQLAEEYGVSKNTIWYVATKREEIHE